MKQMGGILIHLYSLKILNFHSPKNWEKLAGNEIKFNEFFTKTPKISLYIYPFILK